MTKTMKSIPVIVLTGFCAFGCNGRTLVGDVPDSGSGAGPDSGSGADGAGGPDAPRPVGDGGATCTPPAYPGDQPFTVPADLAGVWTGYFEGYKLPSGSDTLMLSLNADGVGAPDIRIVIGNKTAPPPATDPTKIYPSDLAPTFPTFAPVIPLIEGFAYEAHTVKWDGPRLTFDIAGNEAWQSWCALQSSYETSPGGLAKYNCAPGWGGAVSGPGTADQTCFSEDQMGNITAQIPCAQFWLCSGQTCSCDACGCSAGNSLTDSFDITFSDTSASGVGSGHSVRLTRTGK